MNCAPTTGRAPFSNWIDATVMVTRGNETVGGTSIMGLMMLAAGIGTKITIEATGNEATAAVEALAALVSSGFGEED